MADDLPPDLTTLPLDEVRSRRAAEQEVEVGLSYLRRLVQGRLDILAAAARRRAEGGAGELSDLVDALPGILADHVHAPGPGRLPTLMAPSPEREAALEAELDAVAPADAFTDVDHLSDDEVAALLERLTAFEREISDRRRAVHQRIDALQAELTRRYKTGEASVESLLK